MKNKRWIKADNKKLSNAISTMILNKKMDLQFFGYIGTKINFLKNENIAKTVANINDMEINIHYNSEYIEGLTQKQVNFLVLHNINHILLSHPERATIINSNTELIDLAQDMIINNIIDDDISRGFYDNPPEVELVPNGFKNNEGDVAVEPLFLWLKKELKKYNEDLDEGGDGSGETTGNLVDEEVKPIFDRIYKKKKDGGEGQGEGGGQGGSEGKGQGNPPKNSHHGPDTHARQGDDEHGNSSKDEKEAIVDSLINEAKSRGLMTSNMEAMLNKLKKSKRDYLKDLKKAIDSAVGRSKWKSFVKPNRRGIEGLKGYKRRSQKINVLLDTSGSMMGDFNTVLSYIFQKDLEINLIQVDTEVKADENIKSLKQLQDLKIEGLGGTYLTPGIEYIKNHRDMKKYNTVILTDGWTESLNLNNMKKVIIISTDSQCPIESGSKNVRQVIVDKEDR